MVELIKRLFYAARTAYRKMELRRGFAFGQRMIKEVGHITADETYRKSRKRGNMFDLGVGIALGMDNANKFGTTMVLYDVDADKMLARYIPGDPPRVETGE